MTTSREPQPPVASAAILNAMSIDVEDYFQVSAFDDIVRRQDWASYQSRVSANTERLLEIFADAGVRSTFFVLGWVAERYPALVRRISDAGHEVASHGYEHRLVYEAGPTQFREDLRRAKAAIEAASGVAVHGYRAPSYSITSRSMWALDVLIEEGYIYDSSIYPIRHDRYGIPGWTRHITHVERPGGRIWELPGSTVRHAGVNLPIGGGGYFRLLPYWWTHRGIRRINEIEKMPAVFYLHPWEIDPAQPRLQTRLASRIRHYHNLHKTEARLRQLLRDFRFGAIADVMGLTASSESRPIFVTQAGEMWRPADGA